jgi:hypothetical protein
MIRSNHRITEAVDENVQVGHGCAVRAQADRDPTVVDEDREADHVIGREGHDEDHIDYRRPETLSGRTRS